MAPGARMTSNPAEKTVKHRRRYCRVEGCSKVVKSQGLCCTHGAKPKMCSVAGCLKQAQGNFDGMCKVHFKEHRWKEEQPVTEVPTEAAEASVYDSILPLSIAWTPNNPTEHPLVRHLREGFDAGKPSAWHRNQERVVRGLTPVTTPALQLEGWERELAWMEMLVLAGCPDASFRHLARGWGRDKGFHTVLAQYICQRRGNIQRKAREAREKQPKALDIWGEDYGDTAYNESLAADLIEFAEHARTDTQFHFDHEDDTYDNEDLFAE